MTSDRLRSIDSLLTGYVAGSLPLPVHVMVGSHLELSGDNRSFVSGLETAAGDALTDIEPDPVQDRDALLDRIFASEMPLAPVKRASCDVMPRMLYDFVGHSVDDIPWKTKMPGFKEFDLPDVDGCHVSMFWIKPGRAVPSHTHEGIELSMVLDGAFQDDRGRFGRGDISIADDSIEHRPVAEKDRPCIGFAVTDGPLRLTGPLYKRIGDIIAG